MAERSSSGPPAPEPKRYPGMAEGHGEPRLPDDSPDSGNSCGNAQQRGRGAQGLKRQPKRREGPQNKGGFVWGH